MRRAASPMRALRWGGGPRRALPTMHWASLGLVEERTPDCGNDKDMGGVQYDPKTPKGRKRVTLDDQADTSA
ncbi:hypothetical protein NDU88_003085 [Pleurodeles waltl]|uniref:Uncharacterized protein n=1 Tax=Pleurodeles waltl TaxID=8319 RepID=A0AAV7UF64_PLEWA|nr:hypothetical protein NDU88_003085 [Pleurodeles waltl]